MGCKAIQFENHTAEELNVTEEERQLLIEHFRKIEEKLAAIKKANGRADNKKGKMAEYEKNFTSYPLDYFESRTAKELGITEKERDGLAESMQAYKRYLERKERGGG